MKKTLFLTTLLVVMLFLASCVTQPNEDTQVLPGDTIELEVTVDSNVNGAFNEAPTTKGYFNEETPLQYYFGFKGNVPIFDVDGKEVQANDLVDYFNNGSNSKIAISYNKAGEDMVGAIQLFDASTNGKLADPVRAKFENSDINSIINDGDNLVFAGNTIVNGYNTFYANIVDIKNNIKQEDLKSVKVLYVQDDQQEGEAGLVVTSIAKIDDFYFFSLANENGKIIKTNSDFEIVESVDVNYVKDLKVSEDSLYALSINTNGGNIIEYDSNLEEQNSVNINAITNNQEKASLAIMGDYAAYTRATDGFDLVNLSDESIEEYNVGTVNGLSFGNNNLFVHSAGVLLTYKLNGSTLEKNGQHYFSNKVEGNIEEIDVTKLSPNFVTYNPHNNTVFNATGSQGVFMYEFVDQDSKLPESKEIKTNKLREGHLKLKINDEGATPEITLDFIFYSKDASYDHKLGIFNYFDTEGLNDWTSIKNNNDFHVTELFDTNKREIPAKGYRISYTANFEYLGLYMEDLKANETYTNYPGLGDIFNSDQSAIQYYIDEDGNNGMGEIIVAFDDSYGDGDYNDITMVIRAYHKNDTITDLFEIVDYQ